MTGVLGVFSGRVSDAMTAFVADVTGVAARGPIVIGLVVVLLGVLTLWAYVLKIVHEVNSGKYDD